jgi:hypothetical protein
MREIANYKDATLDLVDKLGRQKQKQQWDQRMRLHRKRIDKEVEVN